MIASNNYYGFMDNKVAKGGETKKENIILKIRNLVEILTVSLTCELKIIIQSKVNMRSIQNVISSFYRCLLVENMVIYLDLRNNSFARQHAWK